MADVTKELQIVISARDEATRTLEGFKGKLNDVGQDIKKGAVALSALGVATGLTAKSLIDAAGQMQTTRTAFKVLIGDAEEAEKALQSLIELESRTPFTLDQVLVESKKLLAMGTDAKDLTKTLTMLGDVAAGVGFEKLPQLTLAFGQIQAKGRLMGTELRQLTEAGFNLAEAMGVSHAELEEMIAAGEVGFEDVRKAFENVTGEGGRFNGMMEQLAQTVPGRISTMESSIFKLKVALGEALIPAVSQVIEAILPAIEVFTNWAKENQTLVAIIIGAALILGALGITILTVMAIVTGFIAVIGMFSAILSVAITIIGATIAILGGPLTLIILAVMALAALFALAWANNWGGIREKTKVVVDWFKNTAWPVIQNVFELIKTAVGQVAKFWVWQFELMLNPVAALEKAIRGVISAVEKMTGLKGLNNVLSRQHGGFIPGAFNQAVPAILHGGERVIPRVGTDVNPGMGGGSSSVTINVTGSFNLDSDARVNQLAERINEILGRQNELAGKGISI